jgi:Uncharacterized conserved protein
MINKIENNFGIYMSRLLIIFVVFGVTLSSCRKDEKSLSSEDSEVTGGINGAVKGFFLLNEGNMGSNKASLDYFDYETGIYSKNIFAERNPSVSRELGDVGNDIQIYGGKLYTIINRSNLVEVMDRTTAKHLAMVSVPNCRYITFDKGYAYVSSYAGAIKEDPTKRLGYVAKIDTLTMTVVAICEVGYQPEEMVVLGGKLYVANSGGYTPDDYDNRVLVIDLNTFTVSKDIEVAINLHRMKIDGDGKIWVSSRGDHSKSGSDLFIIDPSTNQISKLDLPLPCGNMTVCGDSLYVYSNSFNSSTGKNTVSYALVNTKTKEVVSRNFIKDGTERSITVPYGLAVNPETREIIVTDAKDYLTPGTIYCFSKEGRLKWSALTGDIPAHIVFTDIKLQPTKN